MTMPPGSTGPFAGWELAWQWSPSLVAALAAAAVVAAAVQWHFARGARPTRLVGLASRLVGIAMLVVMASGARVVPTERRIPAVEPPVLPTLSVRSPRWARKGDAVSIDVSLAVPSGPAAKGPLEAEFEAEFVDASGARIASTPLDQAASSAGERRFRGRIVVRPTTSGTFAGSVRVPALDAVPPRPASVRVIDATLNVFLLDRRRFESRFLERRLARDPGVAATVRLLDPGLPDGGPQPLPANREAWAAFDVVVIGGIDPLLLDEASTRGLVEAAASDGVGIIWSLDASADPEAIAVSPLGRLLPVRAATVAGPSRTPYAVAVAACGDDVPWLAVADGVEESREAWRTLPEVFGVVVPTAIRPTARPLATVSPSDGALLADRIETPFILVDRVGPARIVAFLAETWRLRRGARGPLVDRLLSQAIAFAASPRLASRLAVAGPIPGEEADAGAAGREVDGIADATPRAAAADRSRQLWNHPAVLLALAAAFGVEWWIRGRLGEGP